MAEELKSLIEKIQEEGVKTALLKAKTIEDEATRRALEIVENARHEADMLLKEAKKNISKSEESQKASLKQAGRDFLLVLKKEIEAMLDRIVKSHVHQILSPHEISQIITTLVKEYGKSSDIIVSLKKEDREHLEKVFLSELKNEMKKEITLKAADDISGGFIISYDNGKSYYDFSDTALAEYICSYLRPKLKEILEETSF